MPRVTTAKRFSPNHIMVGERSILGIIEGNCVPFIPELIELYRQGRFPFDKLVKFYPFLLSD